MMGVYPDCDSAAMASLRRDSSIPPFFSLCWRNWAKIDGRRSERCGDGGVWLIAGGGELA